MCLVKNSCRMMRLGNDELIPQFLKLVQAVKKFDCPIMPQLALASYRKYVNKVLNETPLEYISLSRPLIREPELPNRWKNGNRTPSTCISCNACYTFVGHFRTKKMMEDFNIPAYLKPICLLPMGYPCKEHPAGKPSKMHETRKALEETVFFDTFAGIQEGSVHELGEEH